MSWSNWVYLGVGIGLGVGSRWLLRQLTKKGGETPLLEQLKQTQLAYQLEREMSQFKAGFLARISHELRSPLNSLIGLHQLILADLCDDPAEERKFVAQAHQSALKLVKLLDEILNVARTENATNHIKIQPLQLVQVLQEVYDLTHLLAADRNLPLQVLLPDPEIYILADPRWLRQVLVSLVDTCILQMEEGSICVSTQATPAAKSAHVWLDVQLPTTAWSDPVDLMQSAESELSEPVKKNAVPSLGLKLLLNQTFLELMEGRLEILPLPTDADESHFTRMQITIPLVIPETASFGQEGN